MPLLLEPYRVLQRGIHHALDVDLVRLEPMVEALEVARTYGQIGPLLEQLGAFAPSTYMHESNFFESKDGYPTARHLGRRLVEAVGISEDYGLDILGAVCGASLAHGLALIDFGAPVCPQWLEVDPSLPHRYCSAEELLDVLDFEAEIDPKAIAEVTEAYDRDSLPVDVSDYLAVDLFEGWGRALTSRLCDFRAHLEKSVSNAGHVMTWYEDPKPF